MSTKLDPMDLYDVRSELSEDEIMVKDTVARYVDDKVIPLMREAFENHEFPRHLVAEVAELGLLGSSIDGYDCAGLNSVSYGLICQELERGDSGCAALSPCKAVSSCSRYMPTVPNSKSGAGCPQWREAKRSAASV